MADGFAVDAEQIRAHARNIDALKRRFDAVKAASAHIAQNDEAYGLLCSWLPAILEGRHKRQDELIAYVEKNLSLVVAGLRKTADAVEAIFVVTIPVIAAQIAAAVVKWAGRILTYVMSLITSLTNLSKLLDG